MSKFGDELIASLQEAVAHARGEPSGVVVHRVPRREDLDVRAVRQKTGLTQRGFAQRFGFSLAALRKWERHERQPEGPARTLLQIIDREPDMVTRILDAAE